MKTYKFTLTENAIHNLMNSYVDHKKAIMDIEEENSEEEMFEDIDYNFHAGCCETAEAYMRVLGVSPTCEYIMKRLSDVK